MTTLPDLLYVALFAVVGPLIGYSVYWPAFRRLAQADPVWARSWLWKSTISEQWTLVAFGAAIWNVALILGGQWLGGAVAAAEEWLWWATVAATAATVAGYLWRVLRWKPRGQSCSRG